ncbi:Predicted oxidoreductase [Persephonella hydrogeniphila]|uniref:Predicted oxidoreductase n=1 Tax=Persephonella hydrogeniphila TaxID=198703 RepID=A0A285MYI3_9AQUI|nr:aldo/keto reductase [Persephonella hydrogeniphila]SNZ02244.1 Predicted oxidoreductase [Persephonella hydrogeniphila]
MNYKKFDNLNLSEIGIGTYLGSSDDITDNNYYETIQEGISRGINVIDTAINYRNMRSEAVIGRVLKETEREKVYLSTKGGYIPVPYYIDEDPTQWFKKEFVETGIVSPSDITQTGNILSREYIEWSFNKSLENLATDYIDIYFIHNPEDQLLKFDRETFYKKLRSVFELLEEKVREKKLKFYGLATWNGFRVPPEHQQFLDLSEIYKIALEVGEDKHHFRFIQFPYNIAMIEAYNLKNQTVNGEKFSTIEAAKKLDIYTYISSPTMQGRLIRAVSPDVLKKFKVSKPVHIPIQFVRSTAGVGTVLIGMSKKEHLIENLEIEDIPPLSPEEIDIMINSR